MIAQHQLNHTKMPTFYSIKTVDADSIESVCRKCKHFFAKGELRIEAVSFRPLGVKSYHADCFSLPPSLVRQGITSEQFVDTMLLSRHGDPLLGRRDEILQAINSKGNSPARADLASGGETLIHQVREAHDEKKRRGCENDEEEEEREAKRAKSIKPTQVEVYEKYTDLYRALNASSMRKEKWYNIRLEATAGRS